MAYLITQGNWSGLLPCVGFFAICFVQILVASLRAYEIQRRELVGFFEWWKDPDGWWPSTFKERRTSSSKKSSLQKVSK